MAQFQHHFAQDLTQDIKIRQCGTVVFNADNLSNVISVDLYNGQTPATLGGSVVGAVICPDGSTVPITNGTISGNTVSITLTRACFAIAGQIGVGIQIVTGEIKTTVLKAVYNVIPFSTDNVIDPDSRVSLDVADLISDIDAAVATIPASYADLLAAVAPTFDTSTAYAAGAYVWYDGKLYRFTTDHAAGSWNAAQVELAVVANAIPTVDDTLSVDGAAADAKAVGEAVADLKSAISNDIVSVTVNKGTLVADSYVKDNGDFVSYVGWSRTGYLSCKNLLTVKLNASTNYCAFYDSNKTFVARAQFTADTAIDVPSLAEYIVISGTTVRMATVTITATMGGLEYRLQNEIKNVADTVITKKEINPSAVIDNMLIYKTGVAIESSDWVCTDYLDLPYDEVSSIIVHGSFYGDAGCAIYGADKNLILAVLGNNCSTYGGQATSNLQSVIIPYQSGMRYIRIGAYKTKYSALTDIYVLGNTLAGSFERIFDVEEDVKELQSNISTTIASSKVLVIGDSISADAYGSYSKWVTVLKNQGFFPADTLNSSQHATGFVARYNNQANDFITRLEAISNPSQYDLVVVFGGINDYIQNIPMGSESGTDYTVSFKPAVNKFFDYLIQNFTQARLCVLLPLRTYQTWANSEGNYQQDYSDYIKKVAKSYCLPILNLTEDSGFCPFISTFSDMWTLQPQGYQSHDGTHPNEEYEEKYLAPMIKGFLQGLM